MGKTSTASKRKYNEKAYERIYVTVPMGSKEKIENAAKAKGISVNKLVWELLQTVLPDSAGE